MSAHNELGAKGERKAVLFLQKKNYEILATNWRYKRCEVDIIAKWKSIIVFAEVKTRSSDFFGHPEEAVDSHKRQMWRQQLVLTWRKTNWKMRFVLTSFPY